MGDVISISADLVNISGFTIQNGGDDAKDACIKINSFYGGAIILGNHITNTLGMGWGNYGIYLYRSDYNRIVNNIVSNIDGNMGLYFFQSCNNKILNNTISNNRWGIYFSSSDENEIIGNTFSSNNLCGIELFGSSDNVIYHNNFIDNNQHVWEQISHDNIWDNGYPSGGNYWDDYTGVDIFLGPGQNISGRDGIGDTPYNISGGNNQDRYPAINYNGWINNPPDAAARPSGPTFGINNRLYTYTTSTTDVDGDQLWYNFSWDDSTFSGWFGPYISGKTVQASHAWAHGGLYHVRVKAKDIYGVESDWSESLRVRIFGVQMRKVEGLESAPPIPPG